MVSLVKPYNERLVLRKASAELEGSSLDKPLWILGREVSVSIKGSPPTDAIIDARAVERRFALTITAASDERQDNGREKPLVMGSVSGDNLIDVRDSAPYTVVTFHGDDEIYLGPGGGSVSPAGARTPFTRIAGRTRSHF
jgi:hypothetical protein